MLPRRMIMKKETECVSFYDTCVGPFGKEGAFCCYECSEVYFRYLAEDDDSHEGCELCC